MKSSWINWSVLPAAFLPVSGGAMAHDQSSSGSQSSSYAGGSSAAPAEKPKPTSAERKENQQEGIASGKVRVGDKQQINREQNATSWNLHRKTPNASTQQGAGAP